MTDKSKSKRNGAIDFWRFIFSLLIVFCHMTLCPSFYYNDVKWFKSGSIGVEFFFILSGFLMAKSSIKELPIGKATSVFIIRKWMGILPTYIFAYTVSIIVKYFLNYGSFVELFTGSIFEIFFLQMAGLSPILNNHEYMVGATWYISAMLLVMIILFPLMYKNRDVFFNILAPLFAIAILGYFCSAKGSLEFADGYGLLRAIAEISLGCVSYNIYLKISKIRATKLLSIICTIVEFSCYMIVLLGAWFVYRGEWDFIAVLLLAIGIIITFSGLSYSGKIFSAPIFLWLGKYSLAIYLNQYIWLRLLQNLNMPLPVWLDITLVMLLTATSSLVCVFVIDFVKDIWNLYKKKITKLFIEGT